MFQKSFSILVAAVLLVLTAITLYAFFNFSGAEKTIDKAEQLIDQQQYARAIAELAFADLSVQNNPALRERLWRLRYAANSRLDNARGALLDVENLLQLEGKPDEELQLDHIRLRASADEGPRAKQLALAFLDEHPGHSRGLELAGEACQTIYRPLLKELRSTIERDVGKARWHEALAALLAFVYRPEGDAEVMQGSDHLAQIYDAEPRLAADWQPLWRQLRDLRTMVQEGLGYFRASLEAGGQPVAAFRGFATALDQSQRTDDLLLQCEIYRRLFDHQFVTEAGTMATWALVRRDQDPAAVATAERWLPRGRIQTLLDTKHLTDDVANLLAARAFAGWRLGDKQSLDRMRGDLGILQAAGQPALMANQVALGGLMLLAKDAKGAEARLRIIADLSLRGPPPFGQPDLAAEFLPRLLQLLQERNVPEADVMTTLGAWQRARPFDLAPRQAIAEFQLRAGNTAAAMSAIDEASQLEPDNDELFALRLEVARLHFQKTNQDGPALLAQCVRNHRFVPDVPDPIGFVLCAEAALEAKGGLGYEVARQCARSATDAFPQVRRPRLLEIQASLAGNRPQDAALLAKKLLDQRPADAATALLALSAYRAAGLPTNEVLVTALRVCTPSPEIQAELLRSALQSAPADAGRFTTAAALAANAPDELRILAAQALARAGNAKACASLLDELAKTVAKAPPTQRTEVAAALTAYLEAAATDSTDDELAQQAGSRLQQLALQDSAASPLLLASARTLAATRPRTAYTLCQHALSIADPETRTGAAWMLAGQLALELGRLRQAEEHWTAALAFAEGRVIAEDLARLCFAQGRTDRALQVYKLVEQPTDAALAVRCGHLDIGVSLLAADLQRDHADLLCHCALATFGQPSLTDWQVANEPTTQERMELLSLLRAPAIGAEARRRAQAMVAAQPDSMTNRLLLARALAASGEPKQAAAMHANLFARGVRGPVFWREIAVAGGTPGYVPDPKVAIGLFENLANAGIAGSPLTLAYGLQTMAKGFADGGFPDRAEQVRLSMWLQAPGFATLSDADVELVAAKSSPHETFLILEPHVDDPTRTDARPVVLHLIAAAERLLRDEPDHAPEVYSRVLRHADPEHAYGCLVHFLIDHGAEFPALHLAADKSRALLLAHLRLIATGHDRGPWLAKTIDALRKDLGADATAAALDELLRLHPSALALWHARAAVLAHLQMAQRGIDDLRMVLAHCQAPTEQLAFVTLAAATLAMAPGDAITLGNLPKELLASPAGTFARGLVALRLGKPDEAVPLLEVAAAQADGLHLYMLALAQLQSSRKNGPERAAEVLTTLARDYPSSSLARNAGSFANQLGPR